MTRYSIYCYYNTESNDGSGLLRTLLSPKTTTVIRINVQLILSSAPRALKDIEIVIAQWLTRTDLFKGRIGLSQLEDTTRYQGCDSPNKFIEFEWSLNCCGSRNETEALEAHLN